MNTPINDGGPAFPRPVSEIPGERFTHQSQRGMTLRDWFAGQALAGLRAREFVGAGEGSNGLNMHINHANVCRIDGASDLLARVAYADADAMLRARNGGAK